MDQYLTAAPVASIIFVIILATSFIAFNNDSIYHKWLLHPYSVFRGERTYTVITSGFIHRDWSHLIFNMVSYFFFAFKLETYLGHWQFGMLYMVSLILSDVPSIVKHKDDYGYHSLGASGAISAVVFSCILFDPTAGMYLMFIPVAIPSWLFGILYLVYCWYASKQSRDTINHDAHFFGAISGVLLTIVLHHHIIPEFLHQFGM